MEFYKLIQVYNMYTIKTIGKLILIIVGIISGTLTVNAQQDSCLKFNKEKSLMEIKNNTPKLVIVGGIVRAARPGDAKFAKKYKIQFIDTGCVIENSDCIAAYNKATFAFLDRKFGKKWRKQVRQDLLGL